MVIPAHTRRGFSQYPPRSRSLLRSCSATSCGPTAALDWLAVRFEFDSRRTHPLRGWSSRRSPIRADWSTCIPEIVVSNDDISQSWLYQDDAGGFGVAMNPAVWRGTDAAGDEGARRPTLGHSHRWQGCQRTGSLCAPLRVSPPLCARLTHANPKRLPRGRPPPPQVHSRGFVLFPEDEESWTTTIIGSSYTWLCQQAFRRGAGPRPLAPPPPAGGTARDQDAGRHVRCRVHSSGNRRAPGRDHLARRVRPAPVDARHGEAPRRRRLLGARAESVLSRGQGADLGRRVEGRLPDRAAEDQAADAVDPGRRRRREGRACVHRVARHAEAGRSQQEDRHAGLLHGRRARRAGRRPRCPNRVGAGASFHGGGLVTTNPNSPHLLAPKIKARMYFGIATNDDMQQPDAKTKLKEAFDAAKVPRTSRSTRWRSTAGACRTCRRRPGHPIYKKDDER